MKIARNVPKYSHIQQINHEMNTLRTPAKHLWNLIEFSPEFIEKQQG